MNTLFGLELPTSVNFVIAFVIVLALIGAATWAVRRFGGTRLEAATRNRQPRLAVIDSAVVDARRRLVIIRRDNVEHLLMIGGASDLVVETNIVRAAAASARDTAPRTGLTDTLPRPMALPDPTPWPLQPEPAVVNPAVRAERSRNADDIAAWPTPESPPVPTPPRAPRAADPLAGLTANLARPPEPEVPARPPAPPAMPEADAVPSASADDQDLAEMAHRLEAALRRPAPPAPPAQHHAPEIRSAPPRPEPPRAEPRQEPRQDARQEPRVEPKAEPRAEPKPVAARPEPRPSPPAPGQTKPAFKSLEQEMASLLGRPGKT